MAVKHLQRFQQLVRQAEGYLDLIMTLSQQWPLRPDVRDPVARRALVLLDEADAVGANGHVQFLRGQAFLALEDYRQAVRVLELASSLDPQNLHIWLALGWCHKRLGQLDLAIQSLNEAVEVDDSEAIVHYNLACYWSLAGNAERSLQYLERAIDIDPNFRDAVAKERDFDPIRHHRAFRALIARLPSPNQRLAVVARWWLLCLGGWRRMGSFG